METLVHTSMWKYRASAFWITWNIGPEHSALRPRIQRGTCRLRFSFFANDFGFALARCSAFLSECWRSARARHEPRRPVGLARLRLEADHHLRLAEGL